MTRQLIVLALFAAGAFAGGYWLGGAVPAVCRSVLGL
jgi:hypothetical protein